MTSYSDDNASTTMQPTKTKENKQSMHDEYLTIYKKYEDKYGKDRVLLMMQVGAFFEMYATITEGPNLEKIASLLNIVCTRKDKSINQISRKNPYMCGFPIQALNKFIGILMNHGYTVIINEQTTPPPKPKREITGIYSPGTSIEHIYTADTNNIACIYIEYEKQMNGKFLPCAGLSSIDLSTGKSIIYEVYSNNQDPSYALDEAYRFILATNPREIVFYYKSNKSDITDEKIIEYLEIPENNLFNKGEPHSHTLKINYKNEILKKAYNDIQTTPLEELELATQQYASSSFVYLINYAYEHNENIINNIKYPEHFINDKYLILGNDAIRQLNILDSDYLDIPNKKIKSVFDVINKTHTAVGRRFLKNRLSYPLISEKDLNKNYDDIDSVLQKNIYQNIQILLKEICDIERIERKLSLSMIQPSELSDFIDSYVSIKTIIESLDKTLHHNFIPKKKYNKQLDKFLEYFKTIFNKDELKKQNLTSITKSFFNSKIYPEIDKIEEELDCQMNFMTNLNNILSELIDEKIYLKKNDRDGYFFSLTKPRALLLQKKIEQNKTLDVKGYMFDTSHLEFKTETKTGMKIVLSTEIDKTNEINELKNKLYDLVKKEYINCISSLYLEYNNLFTELNSFVSYIDFICSCAQVAREYNYVKPIISNNNNDINHSYILAKDLRHPIIERIIEHEYIPHDVHLGDNLKGMLVYGLNSAGKSSYMKAVGINIIMAQCGMYVPAREFIYYPYKSCFTRITGNDNIFKGLSSFALEMTELGSILNRSGPNTLVIGDEICRGTEHVSGNSIVATAIIQLSQANTSFIFATHLHELSTIPEVIALDNVKMYHIGVSYDEHNDTIIYNRKLEEGTGEPIYGITVAKYIIKDPQFINTANKIKNDLLKRNSELVSNKKSRYNSEIFVYECQLCNKRNTQGYISELETHHINHQKDCENGFVKKKQHLQKNAKANLIVVCNSCHDKIHNGTLSVEGYVMTSKGKQIVTNNL
jgi:DNA mismatch repair protein MutS